MKIASFTAAMEVIGTDYHVTLCFGEAKKAKKVKTSTEQGFLIVQDVEYWAHCDLTVAIIQSGLCDARAKYWEESGYSYGLGYKPHFTLGKGDLVDEKSCLIGQSFYVGNEYVRIF